MTIRGRPVRLRVTGQVVRLASAPAGPTAMDESPALDLIRRRMLAVLAEEPRRALEAFAVEDPLELRERAAAAADDDGHLVDPADAAMDGYVALVREPSVLERLSVWLDRDYPAVVAGLAKERPSAALCDALERSLGLEPRSALRWLEGFRELALPERRDVIALMRTGSRVIRELLPGRMLNPKRDEILVRRAYGTLRELISAAVR